MCKTEGGKFLCLNATDKNPDCPNNKGKVVNWFFHVLQKMFTCFKVVHYFYKGHQQYLSVLHVVCPLVILGGLPGEAFSICPCSLSSGYPKWVGRGRLVRLSMQSVLWLSREGCQGKACPSVHVVHPLAIPRGLPGEDLSVCPCSMSSGYPQIAARGRLFCPALVCPLVIPKGLPGEVYMSVLLSRKSALWLSQESCQWKTCLSWMQCVLWSSREGCQGKTFLSVFHNQVFCCFLGP